jgi:hypothetical protein
LIYPPPLWTDLLKALIWQQKIQITSIISSEPFGCSSVGTAET